MIKKELLTDILYEGVTYPKGEVEIPETLEEFVNKINQMINPQVEPEEPKPATRKGK